MKDSKRATHPPPPPYFRPDQTLRAQERAINGCPRLRTTKRIKFPSVQHHYSSSEAGSTLQGTQQQFPPGHANLRPPKSQRQQKRLRQRKNDPIYFSILLTITLSAVKVPTYDTGTRSPPASYRLPCTSLRILARSTEERRRSAPGLQV